MDASIRSISMISFTLIAAGLYALLGYETSLCIAGNPATESSDQTLATYCNDRFGFCVKYPKSLVPNRPPMNGDGQGFHDEHGFVLSVSGINSTNDDPNSSLREEMNWCSKRFDGVTYRSTGANWFILSGYKGNAGCDPSGGINATMGTSTHFCR